MDVFRTDRERCWFRREARRFREQLWILRGLLEPQGIRISEIWCLRPGRVTYQDKHQVVADPEVCFHQKE